MSFTKQEAIFRILSTKAMTQLARELRQRETSTEGRLWFALRERRLAGLKFRRQHPIAGTAYIVDFLCHAAKLVVELDGGIHHLQIENNKVRQKNIEALGYKVIRFSNEDVLQDLQSVLALILAAVKEVDGDFLGNEALTPGPSPSVRGAGGEG